MIRYSRACGSYQNFLDIGLLLTRKILNQGFILVKLKSSLRKFEEFEDTKGAIRIRISKKNGKHNGQKKKVQKNKQGSIKHTYKTKD
jgi:hypothetical protein